MCCKDRENNNLLLTHLQSIKTQKYSVKHIKIV